MGQQKQAKNRKFGRHTRNPSSKLYETMRAERNRERRIARCVKKLGPAAHPKHSLPCPKRNDPQYDKGGRLRWAVHYVGYTKELVRCL